MRRLLATIDHGDVVEPRGRLYATALTLACAAAVVTELLTHVTGVATPFLLGLGAVIGSAWLGGAGPALLASVVMMASGTLIPSRPTLISTQSLVALGLFSLLLSVAGEYVFRTRHRDARQRRRLAQHERYLQSIFETIPAAMMVVDRTGAILAINQAALAIFGIEESDRDGYTLSIHDFIDLPIIHDGGGVDHFDRLSGAANQFVAMVGHPVGGADLQLTVAIAHIRSTDPGLFTLYVRDETPVRRAAEAMADVQSNLAQLGRAAALGAMGSAIAHELNQPLASATNFAGAARAHLARSPNAPPLALSAIDSTIGQIVRAGEILKGLRTFVRAAPVAPQWLDIREIIREASQLGHFMLNEMRVTLTTDIDADVHYVWTDRVQIQQVLVNLLSNAAEAVADRDRRQVRISVLLASADEAEVSITDSGDGVAPEVRERLFEPFNTSKGQGLGVGLAISRTIVEAHGGRIWYEHGTGGARFCLTLRHSEEGGDGNGECQDHHLHH